MKGKKNNKTATQSQIVKGGSFAIQSGNDIYVDQVTINNYDSPIKSILAKLFSFTNLPTKVSDTKFTTSDLDIPDLPDTITERVDLVDDYCNLLKSTDLIYLVGEKSIGKSIISILISKKLEYNSKWISFKNINIASKNYFIESISSVANIKSANFSVYKLQEILSSINHNTIIIIDDLPNLINHPDFSEIFIEFVKICKKLHISLIITSNYKPTQALKTIFKDNKWLINIPMLSNSEISELFYKNNAPQKFLHKKFIDFIAGITKRHPILLNSLIRYLNENDWIGNETVFNSMISGNFAQSDKNEYYSILTKTINDDKIKELIYRLDVINSCFTNSHIRLVSEIEPSISFPLEKLLKVKDLWIQESKGEYCISPLIKDFGSPNLNSDVVKQINIKMAKSILSKNIIDPIEASNAIIYYFKAECFNEAAHLLIFTLHSVIISKQTEIYDYAIFSIWANQQIPKKISLDLRIAIRSFQLRAFEKINRDTKYVLQDLESLIDISDLTNWLGLLTSSLSLAISQKRKLKLFYKSIIKTSKIKNLNKLLPNNNTISIEETLFVIYSELKSHEDFIDWLSAIEQLPAAKRNSLFSTDKEVDTCISICDRIFLLELGKNKSNQNWEKTIQLLSKITGIASDLDLDILFVSAICNKIIIKAEHQDLYKEAIRLGIKTIEEITPTPMINYLLNEVLARECLFNGDYKQSNMYFEKAISEKLYNVLVPHRIYTYLWFSQTLSHLNDDRALAISLKSVELLEKHINILPKYLSAICYCEYAIQLYLNKEISRSLIYFSKVSLILHNENMPIDFMKEKFTILGNFVLYIRSMINTGNPPKKTNDGIIFMKPNPGAFLKNYPNLKALYNDDTKLFNAIVMTDFAIDVFNDKLATFWSKKSLEITKTKYHYQLTYNIVCNVIIPNLLLEKKYLECANIFHKSFNSLDCTLIGRAYGTDQQYAYKNNLIQNLIIPTLLCNGLSIYKEEITISNIIDILNIFKNSFKELIDSQNDDVFNEITNILTLVLSKSCNRNDAVILANGYTEKNDNDLSILTIFSTSLNPNNSVNIAIEMHRLVCQHLQQYYQQSKFRYINVILPFFQKFWGYMFNHNRFRFRSPDIVKRDLDSAFNSDYMLRIEKIIRIIESGI